MGVSGGADGPNWFVGDDDFVDVLGGDFREATEQLIADDVGSFAKSAFGTGLANAENGRDVIAQGSGYGKADLLVAFVENLAALGMADNAIVN